MAYLKFKGHEIERYIVMEPFIKVGRVRICQVKEKVVYTKFCYLMSLSMTWICAMKRTSSFQETAEQLVLLTKANWISGTMICRGRVDALMELPCRIDQ